MWFALGVLIAVAIGVVWFLDYLSGSLEEFDDDLL